MLHCRLPLGLFAPPLALYLDPLPVIRSRGTTPSVARVVTLVVRLPQLTAFSRVLGKTLAVSARARPVFRSTRRAQPAHQRPLVVPLTSSVSLRSHGSTAH